MGKFAKPEAHCQVLFFGSFNPTIKANLVVVISMAGKNTILILNLHTFLNSRVDIFELRKFANENDFTRFTSPRSEIFELEKFSIENVEANCTFSQ